jgi:hypothetical protein
MQMDYIPEIVLIGFDHASEGIARKVVIKKGAKVSRAFGSFHNAIPYLKNRADLPDALMISNVTCMDGVDIQIACAEIAEKVIVEHVRSQRLMRILMRKQKELVRAATVFTERAIPLNFFDGQFG